MKCVDCLPSLEEFFDGEVDDKTAERMRDHLAACADCAEAFDALRSEQEMFLRYDRGLEVSPALWQGVRAAIAAADIEAAAPEAKPRPRSFLSSLREQLAAAVAVFAARPALASSLALLALGVTAGALWFSNPQRHTSTTPTQPQIADNNGGSARPAPTTTGETTTKETPDANPSPSEVAQVNIHGNGSSIDNGPAAHDAQSARRANPSAAESLTPNPRTNANAGRDETGGVVTFVDAGHEVAAEDPLTTVAPASLAEANLADAAAVLDPEDEAVARHVGRAQVLLRSIKNTRVAEGEGDLAYEREMARKLLAENASLQIDADADNNKTAQRVLKELEPYLNDIANLRDKPARGELRSIRERMERQEIIAALHVYDD